MQLPLSAKKWFITTALSYLGTPYIWSGDDPSGFDCSGFVLECLKSIGLIDEHVDHTADSLLNRYQSKAVDEPNEGALLFFLNDAGLATHVVICLDEYFQIGANGGTSKTTDLSAAWRDNAFIKIRPIHIKPNRCKIINLFK
jgi:peptidoglycan DL-endopeptidase LytE